MPSTGYYIYLCPTAMTVVVSGLTATVEAAALVVGWGIFKNITTNFVGAPGQVLAQAFVLFAAIDGLKAQLENLGETKAVSIDFENSPKLCGQDMSHRRWCASLSECSHDGRPGVSGCDQEVLQGIQ